MIGYIKNKYVFIVFVVVLVLVGGCKKGDKSWDIDVYGPIASTSLGVENLVKTNGLVSDSSGALSFLVKEELVSLDFDSLFRIPDTTINTSFTWPFGNVTFQPGDIIFAANKGSKYHLKDVQLIGAVVRSGTIEYEYQNTISEELILDYKMPSALKNGVPLSFIDTILPGTSLNPSISKGGYDISGYELDLKGVSGNSYNELVSLITVFLSSKSKPATVTTSDYVNILNTYSGIIPEYAKGYFGQLGNTIQSGSGKITVFKNLASGVLDFEAASLNLTVRNGIGVDIQAKITEVTAYNTTSGSVKSVSNSLIGKAININRSKIAGSIYPPITYSQYDIELSKDNSNLDKLFDIYPDSIVIGVDIQLNPLGNISNNNDFIFYGHGIEMEVLMEMPFSLKATNLTLVDTMTVSFSSQNPNNPDEKIKIPAISGLLYLNAYNGFPFSADIQLYLQNEMFQVTDSILVEGNRINAGELNEFNRVEQKMFSRIPIPVDSEKIEKIRNSKSMIVKLIFNTKPESSYVKIYDFYSFDLKIIADFNIETKAK